MSLLLVSYDLNVPGKDYDSLYECLKSAGIWWHYLDSTWIISTSDTLESLAEKIRKVIDANDNLLVVDITGQPRQGWLKKTAWAWLNEHH